MVKAVNGNGGLGFGVCSDTACAIGLVGEFGSAHLEGFIPDERGLGADAVVSCCSNRIARNLFESSPRDPGLPAL